MPDIYGGAGRRRQVKSRSADDEITKKLLLSHRSFPGRHQSHRKLFYNELIFVSFIIFS
jgi:hypothetical protein